MGYDRVTFEEHGYIISLLQKEGELLLSGKNTSQRIIQILLPRASYKTTIASISFPMWLLKRNPNMRIMLDSETYNLSKSILSEIKQQYETGPYTRFYPAIDRKEIIRWAEDSIIIPERTMPKKEGNIAAAGLDGVKAGMHYDLIIADDLHSQNNTRTRYQIDGVIEHYRLLLSILEPNGLLIVIGTRWAEEDAYTIIQKDATANLFIPATSVKPMNLSSKCAESEDTHLVYDDISDTAVNANKFYLNFPNVLNLEHLSKIEKRQGPFIFSAQYLLKPVASKESRFREEWLEFYEETTEAPMVGNPGFDPTKPRSLLLPYYRRVGLVDPAFTTAEYSDYSGIVIVAADSARNMYTLHADQIKVEPFQLVQTILEMKEKYKVHEWYIEEVAAQKVLKFFVQYMAGKENKQLFVGGLKSYGKKKELRVMSLQLYFANRKIFLRRDQETLLHQLRRFPILRHDDVLDALAYAPQVVFDGVSPEPLKYQNDKMTLDDLRKELAERDSPEGLRPRDCKTTYRRLSFYA